MKVRRWAVIAVLLVSACRHATPVRQGPGALYKPSPSTPAFQSQSFQPAIWPFATRRELAHWRSSEATIPWATDRLEVARHFATDVLHLHDVKVRPHCATTCQDVDLVLGGRIVSDFSMQEEADARPVAWSVSGATAPGLEQGALQTGGDPLVVSGIVQRPTDLTLRLVAHDGRVLSTATTRTRTTWMVSLASPAKGLATLVTERTDARGINGIDLRDVLLSPAPRGVVRCEKTRLVVQAPSALDYGYTGDHSFGFTIANVGDSDCTLDGYAGLRLRDGRGVLPFVIHHGSRSYYRDPGAHPVVLHPQDVAVIAVEKYRCDSGVARGSTYLDLILPRLSPVTLTAKVDYCKPGRADPGNLLTMTAVAPTLTSIYRPPP